MALQIIDRKAAWEQGKKRYFTGKPCKQGHIAERFVSTGGCVNCVNPYVRRQHPFDRTLIPYACPKLWVKEGLTPAQYEQLATYMQQCVDTFVTHVTATDPVLAHAAQQNPSELTADDEAGYS